MHLSSRRATRRSLRGGLPSRGSCCRKPSMAECARRGSSRAPSTAIATEMRRATVTAVGAADDGRPRWSRRRARRLRLWCGAAAAAAPPAPVPRRWRRPRSQGGCAAARSPVRTRMKTRGTISTPRRQPLILQPNRPAAGNRDGTVRACAWRLSAPAAGRQGPQGSRGRRGEPPARRRAGCRRRAADCRCIGSARHPSGTPAADSAAAAARIPAKMCRLIGPGARCRGRGVSS